MKSFTLIGIFLAFLTASNLFFYEKVVKKGSFVVIGIGASLFYMIISILLFIFNNNSTKQDTVSFFKDSSNIVNFSFYIVTMSFSYVWFLLTKEKNVELSSIYDVLYIPILVVFGILFSEKKLDLNFIIAAMLIIAGVLMLRKS